MAIIINSTHISAYRSWCADKAAASSRHPSSPSGFVLVGLFVSVVAWAKGKTQMRFKMQKDGESVWDQMVIDRLWVTTQREAMIKSGQPAEKPAASSSPAKNAEEPKPK